MTPLVEGGSRPPRWPASRGQAGAEVVLSGQLIGLIGAEEETALDPIATAPGTANLALILKLMAAPGALVARLYAHCFFPLLSFAS